MTDLAWVPQSCTLPTQEQPLRVAEWDALFSERLTSLSRPHCIQCSHVGLPTQWTAVTHQC